MNPSQNIVSTVSIILLLNNIMVCFVFGLLLSRPNKRRFVIREHTNQSNHIKSRLNEQLTIYFLVMIVSHRGNSNTN